jgi:hypothetical protein
MAEEPLEPEVTGGGTPPDIPDDEPEVPAGGDPTKALHAERGKRKETARQLRAAQEELARVRPMAAEYEQLLPVLPELLSRSQAPQPGQPVPQADPDVIELAQDLGLVDDDGNLDIARATRLMQRIENRTGRMVAAHTAPVRAQTAAQVASQVTEKAYKAVDQQGNPYATRAAIDQVFRQLPPESLADPNTAVMALVIARGLGGPGGGDGEPTYTEGQGRMPRGGGPLSQMERSIMKMRGKSEADWRKLTPDDERTWELEAD